MTSIAMDPTREELDSMVNIDNAADWAELPHRPIESEAPDSPRGSFFSHLGATPTTRIRTVAAIPEQEFQATVEAWQFKGAKPNTILRASAGLVGMACRMAAGIQPTHAQALVTQSLAEQAAQLQWRATIAQQAMAAPPQAQRPSGNSVKIKLATVVDQANDNEVEAMEGAQIKAAYATYASKQGDVPPPQEDLTTEQLTGLRALFSSSGPPYVDLAIWGPYGRRIQKKLRMKGLVLQASGRLATSELYGPPNFEEWMAGWNVFKTGCIMLGEISPAVCDLWSSMIRTYAVRYGQELWPLVYQADVRARLEHLPRVKRMGMLAQEQALAANGTHPFDPMHPWEWTFREAANDAKYWRTELEENALIVKTGAAAVDHNIGDDAPVEGNRRKAHKRDRSPVATSAEPPRRQPTYPAERVHRVNAEGLPTHNRRGMALCEEYQTGKCTKTKGGYVCGHDKYKVHQCGRCLAQGHGREHPHECRNTIASVPSTKGGKGGKGGKNGKGGKSKGQF